MIKIEIQRNSNGMIFALRVSGHSGTADKGGDIVCAGVSVLAQAAVVGLSEHLHREVDYSIDPDGELKLRLKGDPDDLTEAVLETVRLGFVGVAEASPGAVRITTKGRPSAENK